MIGSDCAILVVAKAPVVGLAKTRLAPAFGADGAAELAAAALLDTLVAVRAADVGPRIVALTGDLSEAQRSEEITGMLEDFTVISSGARGSPSACAWRTPRPVTWPGHPSCRLAWTHPRSRPPSCPAQRRH